VATGAPVPWDAEFRIGSFTKPFVATTLPQLVGQGRLSLDDTVGHWLPGVVTGNGNDGDKVTVRRLLQHTGGIPNYTDAPGFLPGSQPEFDRFRVRASTPEQLVATAMTRPPSFAPGTEFRYSNTDYVLAGMIIERVTGHRWQDEVTRRIIRPLGLRHTYIPTSPFIRGPHARGYARFAPDGPLVDVTAFNPTGLDAAGGIVSTTGDGNRFLRALVRGELLRPAELAAMETTVPAPQFSRARPVRYGLGIMWTANPCGGEWSHGGDVPGFATLDAVRPDGSRSVVVSLTDDKPTPKPGVPLPTQDPVNGLIDHALCG
jgi:D-alanyl-D-alanine carboxypeptidase